MAIQGIRSKQVLDYQSKKQEAGEMAQQGTTPVVLAEIPASVPSIYMVVQPPITPVLGDLMPAFDFHRIQIPTPYTEIYSGKTLILKIR